MSQSPSPTSSPPTIRLVLSASQIAPISPVPGKLNQLVRSLETSSISSLSKRDAASGPICCLPSRMVDRYTDCTPFENNHIKVRLDGDAEEYRLNSSPIFWRDRPLGEATCAPLVPCGAIFLLQHLSEQKEPPILLRLTDPFRLRQGSDRVERHEMSPYLPMHMEALSAYLALNSHKIDFYESTPAEGQLIVHDLEGAGYRTKKAELLFPISAQEVAKSIGLTLNEATFQMSRQDRSWGEEHRLTELYVPDWADGRAMDSRQLLKVLLWIREHAPGRPLVVHCSAGVSRTAVVFGYLMILEEMSSGEKIPSLDELKEGLMSQRCFAITNVQESMLQEAIELAAQYPSIELLRQKIFCSSQ